MNWDYIAGIFDGEGSAFLGHVPNRPGPRVRLTITNTDRRPLDEIRAFCGFGNVHTIRRRQPHWKQCYHIEISRHDYVQTFCENVLPRCIIKREPLQEILDAIETHKWPKYGIDQVKLRNLDPVQVVKEYWKPRGSLATLGKKYGANPSTMRDFMVRRKIPRRPRSETRLKHISAAHIQELYIAKGKTVRQIGSIYGASHVSVHRFLRKYGIFKRGALRFTNPDEIRHLYSERGFSQRRLAAHYGVNRETVIYFMKKNGIPMRPKGHRCTLEQPRSYPPEVDKIPTRPMC